MILSTPPLSLYLHLPWCVRKCPYCDFNSHRAPEDLPEGRYVDALLADLEQDLPMVWGRTVSTIFIGGGTPSLFGPAAIERLLDGIRARITVRPGAEVSMEANPGTLEHAPFAEYRAAGINRLSLGVQSFDDQFLERLGRIHHGRDARRAAEGAIQAGFEHLNLDLMFALPGQTVAAAVADVDQALALGADHISHYQLTIEPNTLFHRQPPPLPDDDLAWAMQQDCAERLVAGGFEPYEISAWARPGGHCQHNLNYWQFGDYLGIGAGAHGKITDGASGSVHRYWKERHPTRYLASAARPARVGGRNRLGETDLLFEFALNVFRLADGVPADWFSRRTGLELDLASPPWAEAIERGWISVSDERLRPTTEGQRLLNELQLLFLADAA